MKVSFFKKPSRKTGAELEIVKKIKNAMENDPDVAARVEAYVIENGAPTDIKGLLKLDQSIGKTTASKSPTSSPQKKEPPKENPNQEPEMPKKEPPVEETSTEKVSQPTQPAKTDSKYSEFAETVKEVKQNIESSQPTFDPFQQPVKQRDYTQVGISGAETHAEDGSSIESGDDDIPSAGDAGTSSMDGTAGNDDIPTASGGGGSGGGGDDIPSASEDLSAGGGDDIPSEEVLPEQEFTNTSGNTDLDTSDMAGEDLSTSTVSEPLGGDNLKDLSAGQKKKAAEKTAEVMLNGYKRYGAMHWKAMAKMPRKKIDLMIIQGRINPNQVVNDGVTIKDYVKAWNQEVEDTFTCDEQTLEEIREPLIEVLMEQGLALTPSQRLMIAIGQHQIEMGIKAIQFLRTRKETLNAFIKHNNLPKEERVRKQQNAVKVDKTTEETIIPPTGDSEDTSFEEVLNNVMDDDNGMIETLEAEEVSGDEDEI